MANNRKNFVNGIGIVPNTGATANTSPGDLEYLTSDAKLHIFGASANDALVQEALACTLTNKTISGSSNTLTNIANASLTNSSLTINGSSVSLGGSVTVTATATNALTIGTGLSGTSYNGSTGVTIAIDATVATLTGAQTLTNKTITSATAISIASAGLLTLANNGQTVTLGASATASASYAITYPAAAPATNTSLLFNGTTYVWSATLVNPMTTSGDTIYGGASGVTTRLAGDTSNARKFLNSTASSGTAQAPAWNFQRSYLNKTAAYSLAIGDDSVLFNISSAAAATLPTAASVTNQDYFIRNYKNSTASLTINTTSAQTVDGRASGSIILSPGDSIHVISDGANWQALDLKESINARYTGSNSTTYSSAFTVVVNATKDFDTHNAYDGTTYTVPASGKYEISAGVAFAATTSQGSVRLALFKGGSQHSTVVNSHGGTVSVSPSAWITTTVNCVAGDTLDIRLYQDIVGSLALSADPQYDWVTFTRVG